MSGIKSTVSRAHSSRNIPASGRGQDHAPGRVNVDLQAQLQRNAGRRAERRHAEPTLMSDFIAPPGETAEWLGNPAIGSTLAAVSSELAPGGIATSKRNQYVASVVETHLAARKQLAKHLNALLRA